MQHPTSSTSRTSREQTQQHPHASTTTPPPARRTRTSRRIGILGLGYVGLPVALAAHEKGFPVVGFDINEVVVAELQAKRSSILSPEEAALLRASSIVFEAQVDALGTCNTYIICVPTPVHEDHTPDVGALTAASETVGSVLKPGDLVVVESTVAPGMSEELVLPILEARSGLTVERDFSFAFCPERINPGDRRFSTKTIPRVLGASGPKSLRAALNVYERLLDAPITPMGSVREAEAVKMVENAFRDVNIAFVNELALSFSRAGIDLVRVLEGAATKPFGFMPHFPGCGVGGHCIPVDPYYLIQYGERYGFTHRLLKEARRINSEMPLHVVELLEGALHERNESLQGHRVALLGLSYKRNINDTRESPAYVIAAALQRAGAEVVRFDPHVPAGSDVATLDEALAVAESVVIATDHDEFTSLEPGDLLAHGISTVIDGRTCLVKELFDASPLTYRCIGR